jgi:hypothetical protein
MLVHCFGVFEFKFLFEFNCLSVFVQWKTLSLIPFTLFPPFSLLALAVQLL